MNCREGDLAIVVRSACGESIGRILTCIRLSREDGLMNPDGSVDFGPIWETDDFGPDWGNNIHNLMMDADLRPLRDNPGEDESFTWAPKKEPVAA